MTPDQINILRQQAADYGLVASPEDYWLVPAPQLAAITGGCGAESARFDFVPDTVYGLSIQPACNIHDYMYSVGSDLQDKVEADSIFLYNMNKIVSVAGGPLKWLRGRRVYKYFLAVKNFGHDAFWENKGRDHWQRDKMAYV